MEGFSLIEVLVVVGVLGIIGVIMIDLLLRTVSGGNKTQLIDVVKQNGQSSLTTMQQLIRDADAVVCPEVAVGSTTATDTKLVIVKNGVYTRFMFYPNPTGIQCNVNTTNTSKNGCIGEDNPQIDNSISLQTNIDNICSATTQTNPLYLTDTNTVSLQSGSSFTRNTASGYKDVVGINFILGPSSGVATSNPVTFSTSVELR